MPITCAASFCAPIESSTASAIVVVAPIARCGFALWIRRRSSAINTSGAISVRTATCITRPAVVVGPRAFRRSAIMCRPDDSSAVAIELGHKRVIIPAALPLIRARGGRKVVRSSGAGDDRIARGIECDGHYKVQFRPAQVSGKEQAPVGKSQFHQEAIELAAQVRLQGVFQRKIAGRSGTRGKKIARMIERQAADGVAPLPPINTLCKLLGSPGRKRAM